MLRNRLGNWLTRAALLVPPALLLVAGPVWADCGSPPQGFGSAWWRQYARWCACMGGVPNADTISCNGVGGGGSAPPSCGPGWVMTSDGGCMPAGATECGSGYCRPGLRCSSTLQCLSPDNVDCGGFVCSAGQRCGSGRQCLDPDDTDCGGGKYCPAGQACTRSGACMPAGAVDCGNGRQCPAGTFCGSGDKCMAQGRRDCGDGHSCPSDRSCASGGRCLVPGSTDCGTYSCPVGDLCASGGKCRRPESVDCGNGTICKPGSACRADGGCMAADGVDCGNYSCPAGKACGTGGGCRAADAIPCGIGVSCKPGAKCRMRGDEPVCLSTAYRPDPAPPVFAIEKVTGQLESLLPLLIDFTDTRTYQKDLTAALKILAMPWVADVPLAADLQREVLVARTRGKLRDLATKVLTTVIIRMRADTRVLEPFAWDTPATMVEKRRVAQQTEQELGDLQARAAQELATPAAFTDTAARSSMPGHLSIEFTPGPALRRLEEIRRTGQFWD
jgi:hypothetical protein